MCGIAIWIALFQSPALASDFPYFGVVTDKDVEVRSGAGKNFYIAGHLQQASLVEVHKHFYRWYMITPPRGVHSYIKKAFVNRQGDGTVGTVTHERVVVKTAALTGEPGDSFRQQRFLRKGDQVGIVEAVGDYYKIIPPKNTYVFLPPGSVTPATVEQIAAAGLEAGKTSASSSESSTVQVSTAIASSPSADPAAAETDVVTPPAMIVVASVSTVDAAVDPGSVSTPSAPAHSDNDVRISTPVDADAVRVLDLSEDPASPIAIVKPHSPMVTAAEMRLQAVSDQLLDKQPLETLLADYETLHTDPSLTHVDRQIVQTRLAQLKRQMQLAETLKNVDDFRSALKRRTPLADELEAQSRSTRYTTVGQLLTSSVYNGDELPTLYRVVDPASYRTVAYVRPGTKSQATRYLGRLVGIVGKARYDGALKTLIVQADRVDLLEAVEDERSTQWIPLTPSNPRSPDAPEIPGAAQNLQSAEAGII